jgi:RNA polymerase sigma-70 factor (ECF subfamily)
VTPDAVTTERVWAELRDSLSAWFRRRVRDPHAAEDLLQETFVRVHAGLGELRRPDRIAPWVQSIARNVLRDHWRAHRPDAASDALDPDAFNMDELPPAEEDAGNHNTEVTGWLRGLIASLPSEYRDAVLASELGDLTQRELASRLGLSLSGAKSRVQRGRAKLEEQLKACCRFELDRRGNVVDWERKGDSCDSCRDDSC